MITRVSKNENDGGGGVDEVVVSVVLIVQRYLTISAIRPSSGFGSAIND